MVERLSTETERLQWRRNKVLELSSEGRSQPQIASILHVGLATVNRDLQYLRKRARENIGKYINEILPLEYQKCLVGLDAILTKTWDIANSSNGVITITESREVAVITNWHAGISNEDRTS